MAILVVAVSAVGCPVDNTINSSPWLRWKIFAMFGAGRLLHRDDQARRAAWPRRWHGDRRWFFPSDCQSQTTTDKR